MTDRALTERERRDLIRKKVKEVSELMLRLSQMIDEFNDLGVDAAFGYETGGDQYSGYLTFTHEVQDKTVYVNDNAEAQKDARALLDEAISRATKH